MLKLIIVEANRIIRTGLRSVVSEKDNIEVTGEAENGQELIGLLEHQKTDIVLTGLQMPVMNGFEIIAFIKENYPEIKVLVLSAFDGEGDIQRCVESGASGFISKKAGKEQLFHALKEVQQGNQFFCTEVALEILHKLSDAGNTKELKSKKELSLYFGISKRELEVLNLVCEGYTNDQIADQLFTSRRTIESHRQHLLKKTQCRNTAALVKLSVISGLVEFNSA